MLDLEINEKINSDTVFVIDENGVKLGNMNRDDAIETAKDRKLDLVAVGKNATIPTCKIMNYGKYKFEQSKKEKEMKAKNKAVETSEVQISFTIQQNDLKTKANTVHRLIDKGNMVRIVMRLKGRENGMLEVATMRMNEFVDMCSEFSMIKKEVFVEGKDVKVILEKIH